MPILIAGEPIREFAVTTCGSSCPFLFCGMVGWHQHPVCVTCSAVRWGNMFCWDCKRQRGDMHNPIVRMGAVCEGQ